MKLKEIVQKYLVDRGFDGLCSDECGCLLEDFMPCGEPGEDCKPGYRHPCNCEYECEYHVAPRRPTGGAPQWPEYRLISDEQPAVGTVTISTGC